jgi:hypothetical protein
LVGLEKLSVWLRSKEIAKIEVEIEERGGKVKTI